MGLGFRVSGMLFGDLKRDPELQRYPYRPDGVLELRAFQPSVKKGISRALIRFYLSFFCVSWESFHSTCASCMKVNLFDVYALLIGSIRLYHVPRGSIWSSFYKISGIRDSGQGFTYAQRSANLK